MFGEESIWQHEVRMQLRRMLASKRFQAAKRQSEIFAFVVEKTLAKEEVTEEVIGQAIFPGTFEGDTTNDVRVSMANLRRNIAGYYENEGADDSIEIRFPTQSKGIFSFTKGERYKPSFNYAPHHPIEEQLRLGKSFLRSGKPSQILVALECFGKVLEADPSHFEATLGTIKGLCLFAFVLGDDEHLGTVLEEADSKSRMLVAAHQHSASAHLARAIYFMTVGKFFEAGIEIREAMDRDRVLVEESMWYAAFLVRVGLTDRGLSVARRIADRSPEDPLIWALFAFVQSFRRHLAQ